MTRRLTVLAGILAGLAWIPLACRAGARPPAPTAAAAPGDTQHQGITTPHGDHTPHHGGLVLMTGDLHYEVVFEANGRHRVWFTDAVRQDLPASIARDVSMSVARPNEPVEELALEIDDAGESWVAKGRAVQGEGVIVKLTYSVSSTPHEVEIPFVIPRTAK